MGKDSKDHLTKRKKTALGRGIDALLPDFDIQVADGSPPPPQQCAIELIRPNRYQPRRHFAEAELSELSRSIEEQGILQPLLVRRDEAGYELLAGERRLRAAKLAGLEQVPIRVIEVSDGQMLEISIVENVQREDLNPLEEAEGYHRLMAEFHLTQEQVAERVGKSRPAVANILRLRQLPDAVKESIILGRLRMGHARALLALETATLQLRAHQLVLNQKLSVRQTESLVKRLQQAPPPRRDPTSSSETLYFASLADELSRTIGTRVRIDRKGQRGKMVIEFYGNEDLDRLIRLLQKS